MKLYLLLLSTVFFTACIPVQIQQVTNKDASLTHPDKYYMYIFKEDAPPLYTWMLKPDRQLADWMGIRYNSKILHEPINILICDGLSSTVEEAEAKLLGACTGADYLDRYGHSADYHAYVNGEFIQQYPSLRKHTFSDKVFFEANNHGRIFGPVYYKRKYWFVAAFSREKVHVDPLEHLYVSFNQARDNFAWIMDAGNVYKVKTFVSLNNIINNSPVESSGDHDGIAVLLEAVK
jgi:hypothetical protein